MNMLGQALKKVFNSPWRYLEVSLISVLVFLLLVFVPVWTTPGNDFLFQLSILDTEVIILMAVLSVLNAVLIQMQLYIRRTVKERNKLHQQAAKGATAIGIITSALAATIVCGACYSSILALLGLGVTAFLVEYRVFIACVALGLTCFAIYYSVKRINNHCEVCSVTLKK